MISPRGELGPGGAEMLLTPGKNIMGFYPGDGGRGLGEGPKPGPRGAGLARLPKSYFISLLFPQKSIFNFSKKNSAFLFLF